jgi:hypothetical protein
MQIHVRRHFQLGSKQISPRKRQWVFLFAYWNNLSCYWFFINWSWLYILQKLTEIYPRAQITKCIRSNPPAKPILFFDFYCEMILVPCVLSHSRLVLSLPLLLLFGVTPLIFVEDGFFPSSISGSLPLVLPIEFLVRVVSTIYVSSSSTSIIKYGVDTTSLKLVLEVIIILLLIWSDDEWEMG